MVAEINFSSLLGRFHPAIVHLPIGILLIAFLFKLLSLTDRYKKLKSAVRPSLFCGALSAIVSVITGYILSQEGGYDEQLLTQHKWMGFVTTGLSILTYVFSLNVFPFEKRDRKKVVSILFFPLVVLVLVTGHWGGSLTRGEDYLFGSAVDPGAIDLATKRIPISKVEEAEVFNQIIKPLLDEKCVACHGAKKQKGQLRLDGVEVIQKGGKNGKIIKAGTPEESELVKRISLAIEEKEHMPPRRESQLTSSEMELLRWWIEEGATFEKKVNELHHTAGVSEYLKSLVSPPKEEGWVPEKEVTPADNDVLNELSSSGISVARVGANSNFLSISFAGKKKIEQRDLELLSLLVAQVIELNLARTAITNEQLSSIAKLNELRHLHLEYTQISDNGIAHLMSCQKLSYLNLVGTKISNEAVKSVNQIKSLRELYLFDTAITKEVLSSLNPQIKVDTGNYQLPARVTDTLIFRR